VCESGNNTSAQQKKAAGTAAPIRPRTARLGRDTGPDMYDMTSGICIFFSGRIWFFNLGEYSFSKKPLLRLGL
jgi:hypothetical protein